MSALASSAMDLRGAVPLELARSAPASAPALAVSRVPAEAYAGWTAEFAELAGRCAHPNPFMAPAFVEAALARHPAARLVVLAVHRGARLQGVWCLIETRDLWSGGAAVLQAPITPRYDALAHPVLDAADEAAALALLLGQAAEDRGLPGVVRALSWPTRLDRLLPPGARPRHAEIWERATLDASPGQGAEDYLRAAMGSAYKKRLAQERALARQGRLAHVHLRRGEAAEAYETFLALEASGWKGRAGTALARLPADAAHLRAAVAALARANGIGVDLLTLDGRPIAAGLLPEAGKATLFWKTAYDETLARHSPGALLDLAVTRRLFAEGRPLLDSGMMEGTDPATQPWSERLALARATIDLRGGLAGRLARAGAAARMTLRGLKRRAEAARGAS